MPTINQLVRKPRKPVIKKTKAPALRFTYNSLKGKLTREREAELLALSRKLRSG